MKLNVKAFAFSTGILWGLGVMLLTFRFVIAGQPGYFLGKLDKVYPGYCVSWSGAFIGLLWGFVSAAIAGALFAWFYNSFTGKSDS
jgi:hypothetical protein